MMASSTSIDPFKQNVTMLMPDGTPFYVLVSDIDHWYYYAIRVSINYGTQAGACLVMLLVTLCLTRESQRRKPVFILNVLSLSLGFIRAVLQVLYFSSQWEEFYSFFSNDTSNLTKSDFATSVAGTVIPLLMTISINMSLAVQAQTVCKVMERKYYYGTCALSCIILLLAIGFRFAECVTNSIAITSNFTYYSQDWIATGTLATENISIWFFSILFTWKLFWTVWTRKKMGWANVKTMEFLMIMSGCTMIIPSIFACLEYPALDTFPEAGPLAMTTVALLLPLSSLWAAMITTAQNTTFNLSSFVGSQFLSDASGDGSDTGRNACGSLSTLAGPLDTFRDRKGSLAPFGSTTIDSIVELPPRRVRDSTEVDLEAMGVRVDKSYSVSSGKSLVG